MENIRMLERHRRRIAFLVALLIFLLLYSVIIVFQIVTAYFEKEQINQQLSARTERVVSVANNYDALMQTQDTDLINTINTIIEGSLIFSQKRIISNIEELDKERIQELDDNTISIENGWKIYKRSFSKNDENFTVLGLSSLRDSFSKIKLNFIALTLFITFCIFLTCICSLQVYDSDI